MRLALSIAVVVAVVLSGSLVGCPAPPDEGEGEEGEGENQDVDELVDAFLTFFDECEPFGPIARYEPVLAERLLPTFSREDLSEDVQRSFDNPALTFNREEKAACLAELAACSPVFGGDNTDTACGRLFEGNRDVDEGCANSEECVDALICRAPTDVCGACIVAPVGGASCDDDPAEDVINFGECADGFVCVLSGGAALCTAALDAGDDCDASPADACGDGLACEGGVCVAEDDAPDFDAGDACTTTCGGLEAGLSCDDGVCVVIDVAQPGQPCDPDLQNPSTWCVNTIAGINFCVATDGDPGVGVCTALPGAGNDCVGGRCNVDAVCDADTDACVAKPGVGVDCVNGATCADGLVCDDNVDPAICVNAPAAGQACVDATCADDFACIDDICVVRPGAGEACPDDVCAAELVCRAGTCVDADDELVCAE